MLLPFPSLPPVAILVLLCPCSRLLLRRPLPASVSLVPAPHQSTSKPTPSGVSALKSACVVPDFISAEPGPCPGVDFVPTDVLPGPPPGRQNRYLKAGTEKLRVRGWAMRERVIQLHCFEGKTLRQCATILGRSYKHTAMVWAAVAREVAGGKATPEAHREAVRGYLDKHYRRVMEGAQGLLGDAAAYGAVVVAAGKALAELHGIKPEDALPSGFSLEDVGREVRVVSPLLIDRLDQVRALAPNFGDSEGARAGARARWDAVRSVPIEGDPVVVVVEAEVSV